MADWIFEGNPRHYDLDAAVASSREQWWGTPHFRGQMAVGDRVWLQVVGPKDPGIYYIATITSPTYEHGVEPSDPRHFRWRTDIRFEYRVQPPLLRSELEADVELGSFRPFRGFEGSNVPVPPDIASALAARAASRLEALGLAPSPRSGDYDPGQARRVACHADGQVMLIERWKLTQPARVKASAMGTLPRSVEARMRGTSFAARIRVPSLRISLMYPCPRCAGRTPR